MKSRWHTLGTCILGGFLISFIGYWCVYPAKWLLETLLGQTYAFYGVGFLTLYALSLSIAAAWKPRLSGAMGVSEVVAITGTLFLLLANWSIDFLKVLLFCVATALWTWSFYRRGEAAAEVVPNQFLKNRETPES